LPLVGVSCLDHFIDTFDEDVALGRNESTEEADEVRHGLVDCASENARVEIATWSRDSDYIVGNPSKPISEGRSAVVEPIIVGLL